MSEQPAIQLIANLVVHDGAGNVMLTRYDASAEGADKDDDIRWWMPAHELEPYQHPDEAATLALADFPGVSTQSVVMSRVQSFRGRRGWHISFDFEVVAEGTPDADGLPAAWFPATDLPATKHGNWEHETIHAVLAGGGLRHS